MTTVIKASRAQARRGVAVQTGRLNHIDIDSRIVTLHFGVFFDGTGNNADNSELGVQCRAMNPGLTLEQQALFLAKCPPGILGKSYGNAPSNVAKLFDLYNDSRGTPLEDIGGDYFGKIYVPGIGTESGAPDNVRGMAHGTGETGVAERVNQTFFESIQKAVDTFAAEYPDAWVDGVEFDVFGFSRGAAAARHFVNEACKQARRRPQRGVDMPFVPMIDVFLHSRPPLNLMPDWAYNLRVGFVGLFESVVNVGFEPELGDPALAHELTMTLPAGCARKVVQLRARDEHRHNFPLTSVTPTWKEVALPGVHSDIGGGYLPESSDDLLLSPVYVSSEPRMVPLKMTRAYRQAARDLAKFQAQDLVDPANPQAKLEIWTTETSPDTPVNWRHFGGLMRQVYAAVRLRRKVSAAYTLVTLRVMHKLAKDACVPIDFIDENDPAMKLPDELQPIADKLMAGSALNAAEERLLRRKYLHLSAHWSPWVVDSPDTKFVHIDRPTDDGRRVVFSNEGGRLEP